MNRRQALMAYGSYAITAAWLERHYRPLKSGDFVRMEICDTSLRVFVNEREVEYGNDLPYIAGYARE